MDKILCWEVTPGNRTDVDSVILSDEDNWRNVLAEVELSLDRQWAEFDDGDRERKDIGVSVKAVELTEEQLEEMGD